MSDFVAILETPQAGAGGCMRTTLSPPGNWREVTPALGAAAASLCPFLADGIAKEWTAEMRRRSFWRAMGPVIGVLLLCSTVVAGNGASAAVHKESHHDRTSTQTLRQDKRKLVQLQAELDRLDKSIQTTMTQIEAQAGQLGASSGVATTAEIEGQARQLAATAGSVTSAEDEVSKAIEQLFGSYGQEYQALSAETAAIHEEFVKALASGSSVPSTT